MYSKIKIKEHNYKGKLNRNNTKSPFVSILHSRTHLHQECSKSKIQNLMAGCINTVSTKVIRPKTIARNNNGENKVK